MSIRKWFREQPREEAAEGEDVPPRGSLIQSLFGREEERIHALGEYDQGSYPRELSELLRRREEVTGALLRLNLLDREGRAAAIPKLKELLRRYPHPLAYEALIHAFVDAGRYDEAKGVAFAARERRIECERSPYPEVRAETDRLREWSPDEVDRLREEREGKG